MSYLAPIVAAGGEPLGLAPELSRAEFAVVAEILQRDARIHLADSKVTLVHSRLSRRLRVHGLSRFADYLALIARDGQLLRDTVKAAARACVRAPGAVRPIAAPALRDDCIIAIGTSTGGVEALFSLLSALPADCPPVLIVQHMPPAFTAGFAARLDRLCPMRDAGARTLGQNAATCIVYGMPRAARAAGAVEQEYPLNALPAAILSACQAQERER